MSSTKSASNNKGIYTMGQAKLRGTFQQRQAEGVAKKKQKNIERLNAIAKADKLLTPKQRREKERMFILLSSILTLW